MWQWDAAPRRCLVRGGITAVASAVFNIVQQATEQRTRCWKTRADDPERLLDRRPDGGTDNCVCHVIQVEPVERDHADDGGDACAAGSVS